MALDKRARKILMDTFWSSAGWKREQSVSPDDFAYAKARGLTFAPVELSQDDAVTAACDAIASTTSDAVTRAFVASLGTRRLELRSALGSFAVGRHMRRHSNATFLCAYCGESGSAADPNILNFERIKWGGVRHDNPRYIALDLQELAKDDGGDPTDDDNRILKTIFEAARNVGEKGRLADLDRALSDVLLSNRAERRTLIAILGYAAS